jgi:outer membrane protein assembly factor BamB
MVRGGQEGPMPDGVGSVIRCLSESLGWSEERFAAELRTLHPTATCGMVSADAEEVSVEAGAGVTRRAALVRLGGALAGGMMASACGAFRAGNGAGASGTPVAAGSLVWRRQVGGIASLAVSGETVSLGADGGGSGAEALDAATGKPRWSIGSSFKPASVAFAAGGGMVLCSGTDAGGADNITAVSAATGRLLWSAPAYVGNPNDGAGPWLIFADTTVYALIGLPGSHAVYRDDVVLALDGRTGARKWMSRLPPMAMAMAVADGTVYAGSALGSQSVSGEVVALVGATGARRWNARVGAPVAALAVTGGVVAGCWDNLIPGAQPLMYGLDAVDGRVLWQRDLGAVLPIIAAADGVVFAFAAANGGLLAVDALTGKLLWKHTAGGQYPSALDVTGGAVYAGYLDSVQAFSGRTGQALWSYPAEGLVTRLAASSDILYAAAGAPNPGYALYALRA